MNGRVPEVRVSSRVVRWVLGAAIVAMGTGCSGPVVGGKTHEVEIRAVPAAARVSVIDNKEWLGKGEASALRDREFLDRYEVSLDPAKPVIKRHAVAHVVVARDGDRVGWTDFTPARGLVVRVEAK